MRNNTVDRSSTPPRGWLGSLDRAWRLVGTGLSFAIFGLCGVILSLLVIPFIWLLVHPAERRARVGRWLVSKSFALFVWFTNMLGLIRHRISGLEHIADTHSCLIVANHPSLIDVVWLLAIFQRADCVVKSAHWNNPFTMGVIRTAGFVSNRDPTAIMDECIRRLKAGAALVLFPEGTRTVPGRPPAFSRGAASIAIRAGARCLPVRIRCTPTTLTKAERWFDIPAERVLFEVDILAPLDSRAFCPPGGSERQASIALNRHLIDLLFRPLANPCESVTLPSK